LDFLATAGCRFKEGWDAQGLCIFFRGVGMLSVLFRQLMIYMAIVFHLG